MFKKRSVPSRLKLILMFGVEVAPPNHLREGGRVGHILLHQGLSCLRMMRTFLGPKYIFVKTCLSQLLYCKIGARSN